MKFTRRGVTGLIASCALLTVAACGGPNATSSSPNSFTGQTLTLAVGPLTDNTAGYTKYYQDLVTAFHKATGATLKIEYTETNESVENQMIDRAAVSRSGPDMIYLGVTTFPTAYYSKGFASLTASDWQAVGGQGQFYPNSLKLSGPKADDLVGVPLYNVPDAMVYNTSLFKKAGIKSPPKTWNDFIADAEKINDPAHGVYGTGMDPADSTDPWKTLWFMSKQLGSDYVSKDDKTATINSPAVQSATSFWFDWNTKFHIVDPDSLTWQAPNMEAAFAKGKIGELIVQKASDIPLYEAGAVGKNFAFAPTPSIPYGMSSMPPGGTAPGTFTSADGIVIAKYAPKPLAVQFVKVALSTPIQVDQYKLTGELPVTKAAGSKVEALDPVDNKQFIASLQTQEPTPFVAAWGTVEEAMASVSSQLAAKVASGGQLSDQQVKTALAGANSSVQSQLG